MDSSGSIQEANWDTTVRAIGNYWIVSPLLADNCGNRVAGRRFSNERDEYQVKFHTFSDGSQNVKKESQNFTKFLYFSLTIQAFIWEDLLLIDLLAKNMPTARLQL